MDRYISILTDHALMPLAFFISIVAVAVIGCGFLCGWFRKCSACGSRMTLTGIYEEDSANSSRRRSFRECLLCKHQEDLPLPRFPYRPD